MAFAFAMSMYGCAWRTKASSMDKQHHLFLPISMGYHLYSGSKMGIVSVQAADLNYGVHVSGSGFK